MKCVEKHSTIREHHFFTLNMGRFGEKKYFLLEQEPGQLANEACRWLTIGIGGDTAVEKAFKKRFPTCKIYGIEPSPDQEVDFRKYGTVIPYAVGPYHGNFTMRLRKGTGYSNKLVLVKPLHEVLDEYLHTRLIHFATLDIEGAEYQILNELKYGGVFDQRDVTFCQIDVELHFGDVTVKHILPKNFSFPAFYRDFLTESPYVPIYAMNFLSHRKVTFLHEHQPDCLRLFGLRKFYV